MKLCYGGETRQDRSASAKRRGGGERPEPNTNLARLFPKAAGHFAVLGGAAYEIALLRLFGRFFLRSRPEQPPPVRMENTI